MIFASANTYRVPKMLNQLGFALPPSMRRDLHRTLDVRLIDVLTALEGSRELVLVQDAKSGEAVVWLTVSPEGIHLSDGDELVDVFEFLRGPCDPDYTITSMRMSDLIASWIHSDHGDPFTYTWLEAAFQEMLAEGFTVAAPKACD